MLKWSEDYATGIELIDDQHKRLFQYVNDLEDAVRQSDVNHELLLKILDFFEEYAKVHFGNEESCMHRYKCPVAKTNQAAHRRFIESYEYYKGVLKKEGPSYVLYKALLNWAQQWLLEHICKVDLQLKPCVKAVEGKTEAQG